MSGPAPCCGVATVLCGISVGWLDSLQEVRDEVVNLRAAGCLLHEQGRRCLRAACEDSA